MGSDQEYMDFLAKANQDVGEGGTKDTAKGGLKPTDSSNSSGAVPEPLAKLAAADAQVIYVSDTDEPFEPVVLDWDQDRDDGDDGEGGRLLLPDEKEFARLIKHPDPESAEVEIMRPLEWDAQGQYAEVVEAVRRAGRGNDVMVYRVARGGTRAEYWVVTMEEGEGKEAKARVVGMRTLAVES